MRNTDSVAWHTGKSRSWLVSLVLSGLLVFSVSACKQTSERDFVGKWQSSRAVTPIYLAANGEWEIRKDDGSILQYGVWRYENEKIIWSIKQGNRVIDDPTPVLSIKRAEFRLKEQDGTTTIFHRLD